ncbi:16S rRNA (uracil(1498)-N(3))-methyltransferase [Rhodobacteraceae bacterium RKSG542]|uniref:16S rRNA (uracil(1498)-N(3))-methyltransferase n=1 Tax=Pseudovibrio flavus TaxID=2529854 RepID=UPI0012BBE6BE|nr:16S rRNA (uracil(1498)-N(3))-methyltransferase [Pseudovibrio flavus]MTI15833.1 16S rRNA (uracil(1498)-N(3))-methyltransferase [Pseudovibrio flavus]
MPRSEFRMQRLYLDSAMAEGMRIEADRAQANYLLNVLRMKDGEELLVFNGRDGEWRAEVHSTGRKACDLVLTELIREQVETPDLHYLFAPIKTNRLDYMAQKAVEMGAGRLRPVTTHHTQFPKLNISKVEANVLEACEQCGVIHIPTVDELQPLKNVLARWKETDPNRTLIFCDEGEETQNPLEALAKVERGPLAVLIGPEGGFSEEERALLRSQDFVVPMPLGPRVLRADTAAVAAMAVVQAKLGDWF